MIQLVYEIRIVVATDTELAPEVRAEILEHADAQDTDWSQKVMRFVGGALSDAEGRLADALPEGFTVSIEGGTAYV